MKSLNKSHSSIFKSYQTAIELIIEKDKIEMGEDKQKQLSCFFEHQNTLSVLKYYQKEIFKVDSKKTKEKLNELYAKVPKLNGVKETPHLNLTIAELNENKREQEQIYKKLKSENKQDYTYELWDAIDAYRSKKYESALTYINKSLKIAKDRSWQKAFKWKVKILIALKKEKEAIKLMDKVIGDTKLPYSKYPAIHKFVQDLRGLQGKIHAG